MAKPTSYDAEIGILKGLQAVLMIGVGMGFEREAYLWMFLLFVGWLLIMYIEEKVYRVK